MKSWISAGWSFAAGTLVGAFAVLALVASTGIPKLSAEASGQRRPIAVNSAGITEPSGPALRYEPVSVAQSTPVPVKRDKSRSPKEHPRSPRHPECDLQLD